MYILCPVQSLLCIFSLGSFPLQCEGSLIFSVLLCVGILYVRCRYKFPCLGQVLVTGDLGATGTFGGHKYSQISGTYGTCQWFQRAVAASGGLGIFGEYPRSKHVTCLPIMSCCFIHITAIRSSRRD